MKAIKTISAKELQAKLPLPKGKYTTMVIILLILLIGLGTVYYFHVKKEEAAFKDYRFHRLSTISKKWRKMIDNYENSLAAGYQPNEVKSIREKSQADNRPPVIEFSKFPIQTSAEKLNWDLTFDDFIIIKDNTPVFQSIETKINVNTITSNDSTFIAINENLEQVTIHDKSYYTFIHPFTVNFNGNDQAWHVVGLVSEHRFETETKRLDIWILLILLAVLCLIILGFPLIKLLFINDIEKLKRSDVVLVGISVILGAPILVTLFLNGFYYINQYYFGISNSLLNLADKVEQNFNNDVDSVLLKLNDFEGIEPQIDQKQVRDQYVSYFKNISHLDPSSGLIHGVHNFALNESTTKEYSDLSQREYYKVYSQNKFWKKAVADLELEYVVRPVISLEKNAEELVFILNRKGNPLVASVEMPSVHTTILPPGYNFMIIDQEGGVWHHSEKGRSSLEYFLQETRDHDLLKASMTGNIEAEHLINYQGKNYLMRIIPLKRCPLFVITMYDVEFLRYRVSEILSLGSMAILCAFLVTGIVTVITIVRQNKYNAFKYKLFSFYFLEPQACEKYDYTLITLLFILFMLILVAFLFMGGGLKPSSVLIGNMLLMVWGYGVVYQILVPQKRGTKALLLLVIVLINLFLTYSFKLVALQAVFLVILWLVSAKKSYLIDLIKRCTSRFQIGQYHNCYINFLFVWLIFTSIFPAFIYFIKARQIENIIWSKYAQVQMAQAFNAKLHDLSSRNITHFEHVTDAVYFVRDDNGFLSSEEWPQDNTKLEKSDFRKVLFQYRPIYSNLIAATQPFVFLEADNAAWRWKERGDNLQFRYKMRAPDKFKADYYDGNYLYMSSFIPGVHTSEGFIWPIFGFFLIFWCLLLILLYAIITFFVQQIFGISLLQSLKSNIEANKNKGLISRNIILIGVHYAGKRLISEDLAQGKKKLELSMLKLKAEKEESDSVDDISSLVIDEPNERWENYEAFIISNFEYGYKSMELNKKKLILLKTLIEARKHIIIISSIYPKQILDFYTEQIEADKHNEELIHQHATWKYLLGSFSEIIKPLKNNARWVIQAYDKGNYQLSAERRKAVLKELIDELGCGNFLPSLTTPVLEMSLKDGEIDYNQLIITVDSLAYGYYNSIWNSLEQREKFLVYDIAADGFVNLKNDKALYSLMKKGIVKFNDRPCLFNNSFRNHIMNSVQKREINKMSEKIKEQGSWSSIKMILYIVIAAIAVFLFIGEPSFVEDFSTFLSLLAGVAAVMPLVSSMLGGKVE
ncbi:hypothetical protein LVD15_22130 [Fulvivirga maritima]|uniref:hypothetical protein n=1 Tax=Fulvivirga maritima TaxID=2904247 RepID=UPI001F2BF58D|nr:hypothetical protein [Fulvivirga maritima]UII25973.1 hypothetical protein LVD15_22130 [Fulvivirga maritima]